MDPQLQKENWVRCLRILDEFIVFCEKYGLNYQMAYGSCLGAIRHKGFIPWDRNLDTTMTLDDYLRFKKLCLEDNALPSSLAIADTNNGGDEGRQVLRIVLKDNIDKEKYYFPNLDVSVYCGLSNNPILRKLEVIEAYLNHKIYRLKNVSTIKRPFPWNVIKAGLVLVPNSFLSWRFERILRRHDLKKSNYVLNVETVYAKEIFKKEWIMENKVVSFENRRVNVPVNAHEYLTAIYGDYMTPVVFEKK